MNGRFGLKEEYRKQTQEMIEQEAWDNYMKKKDEDDLPNRILAQTIAIVIAIILAIVVVGMLQP